MSLSPGTQPPGDTARRRATRTDPAGAYSFDSLDDRDYILYLLHVGMDRQWRAYRGVRSVVDTLCIEMRASPLFLGPPDVDQPPREALQVKCNPGTSAGQNSAEMAKEAEQFS